VHRYRRRMGGRRWIQLFDTCDDPSGKSCKVFEDHGNIRSTNRGCIPFQYTLPENIFALALAFRMVFIVQNNRSIVYDVVTRTLRRLFRPSSWCTCCLPVLSPCNTRSSTLYIKQPNCLVTVDRHWTMMKSPSSLGRISLPISTSE
jgi:hypothetical protein